MINWAWKVISQVNFVIHLIMTNDSYMSAYAVLVFKLLKQGTINALCRFDT
jgi:hypothetical protein